jgi:translation elongation factor EF-1beta
MAEETSTTQDDWVANAANSIIDVVDRAKTMGTDNAVRALRGIVFGLVALVFVITAIIFAVVIMVRLADAYLPIGAGVGDATWAAHLFIGSLLALIGFGLWGSRKTENLRRLNLAFGVDALIIVVIVSYAVIDGFS